MPTYAVNVEMLVEVVCIRLYSICCVNSQRRMCNLLMLRQKSMLSEFLNVKKMW